ncbi:DUF6883 domain-containing protein [Argonema galeatum]|uniref:DUF6883 domain-containing protein n=1 Tax=Argonema galeatum TaxID=2942762 RepID=UPI00201145F9|nr:DUF6883 domain-containing protein [Argonema galeatum]MCL1466400.1 hypothetical protein [Argonema galeatum A003/A1]
MTLASRLEFPLSKAQYLFNRASQPGEGGDKQNFWRSELGFESPEAIQDAILAAVSVEMLQPQDTNEYGERFRAYVRITRPNGISRRIRTVWIILFNEDIARFVTAVPDRLGGL